MDEILNHFHDMYFNVGSIYDEADFERRFRMPRNMFNRIYDSVCGTGIFVQRTDATGRRGIHPKMRVISTFRMMGYGMSLDSQDELCQMSASAAAESLESFADAVIDKFGDEYVRLPKDADLRRILSINEARGFSGCIGSWDCQHWQWGKCPIAWA